MKATYKIAGSRLEITIEGHVTGLSEVASIKDILNSSKDSSTIEFYIKDAMVIPSALIGLLIKEVNQNDKQVILKNVTKELKELVEQLSLSSIFQIR